MSVLSLVSTRPALDVNALRDDLHAVLVAYGLAGADYTTVAVTPLVQADTPVGVRISGMAWTSPPAPTSPTDFEVLAGGAA